MDQRPGLKSRRRRRKRQIAKRQARQYRTQPLGTQLGQRQWVVTLITLIVLLILAGLQLTKQLRRQRWKPLRLVMVAVILLTGFTLIRMTSKSPVAPTAQILQTPKFTYNVRRPPRLKESQRLQAIVNELVSLAAEQALPLDTLSITLIDVKTRESAGYRQEEPRYPASVAKLFWMVVLYDHWEKGVLQNDEALAEDVYNMLQHSDNNAASRIIDRTTFTESGSELAGKELQTWLKKRQQINQFFQSAGYQDINLINKTFPIAYLALEAPEGREDQLRDIPGEPNRNQITTEHAARLMYEIISGQAVSPRASQQMRTLLNRDLRPEAWQGEESDVWGFNPIVGFMGQSLPADTQFASKAGWTSKSRAEVACVATSDGETVYILAIFGDAPAYSDDWKIFPKMSLQVFNRMRDDNYAVPPSSNNRFFQLLQP